MPRSSNKFTDHNTLATCGRRVAIYMIVDQSRSLTKSGPEQFPKMQPSMFNLRVPLEARDDVFLMNTLTDAQLIVSSDVAALLDRAAQGEFVGSTTSTEEREALDLLRENGFPRRRPGDGAPDARSVSDRRQERQLRTQHHAAHDAAVQLRLRLLLPGRSRRLQQERREDVDRHGVARRRVVRARARSRPPAEIRADVLRRRAAAQPAGDVPAGRARVARRQGTPHRPLYQHHHQRTAAHAGSRRSVCCRSA